MSIQEIKERIKTLRELEEQLMTAGPARSETIYRKQNAIQEFYYDDVSDLIGQIEGHAKAIERVIADIQARHDTCKAIGSYNRADAFEVAIDLLKAVNADDQNNRTGNTPEPERNDQRIEEE